MAREPFLLLTIAALAGASLWLAKDSSTDTTPPSAKAFVGAAAVTTPAAATDVPARASGELTPAIAPPDDTTPDRERQLELPDGTFVATLNGATNAKPIAEFWGSQIPWSPIVGIELNDQGVAWYRHENGSYSTTETKWDSAGKRHVTLTRVAHQGPAAPAVATGR